MVIQAVLFTYVLSVIGDSQASLDISITNLVKCNEALRTHVYKISILIKH